MRKENMTVSVTAVVKGIIREFVEGKESVDRKDIVACINERVGQDDRLTDGVIAGALKIMVNTNELEVLGRGKYKKGSGKVENHSIFERVCKLCDKFNADLDRACIINMMALTEGERAIYNDFVKELIAGKDLVNEMAMKLRALVDSIPKEMDVVAAEEAGKLGEGATEAPSDMPAEEGAADKESNNEQPVSLEETEEGLQESTDKNEENAESGKAAPGVIAGTGEKAENGETGEETPDCAGTVKKAKNRKNNK